MTYRKQCPKPPSELEIWVASIIGAIGLTVLVFSPVWVALFIQCVLND